MEYWSEWILFLFLSWFIDSYSWQIRTSPYIYSLISKVLQTLQVLGSESYLLHKMKVTLTFRDIFFTLSWSSSNSVFSCHVFMNLQSVLLMTLPLLFWAWISKSLRWWKIGSWTTACWLCPAYDWPLRSWNLGESWIQTRITVHDRTLPWKCQGRKDRRAR